MKIGYIITVQALNLCFQKACENVYLISDIDYQHHAIPKEKKAKQQFRMKRSEKCEFHTKEEKLSAFLYRLGCMPLNEKRHVRNKLKIETVSL